MKSEADMLFEVSWEVCNKVGGIYTVVMSKAALMKKSFKDYFLVGPYFKDKAKFNFEHAEPSTEISEAINELKEEGIICHFGKWTVKGEPYTILIDFSNYHNKNNDIKKWLWEEYKIDSLDAGWEFEEPMLWSYCCGKLIEKIVSKYPDKKASMHAHEWMSGFGMLYLKSKNMGVGKVFTTHATMLGRTIAGNNMDLYAMLDEVNPEEMAYKLKVQSKFLTERACAHNADVFTTVSEITSIEAEKLLGRKADVLVLNGLDINKFPTIEETSIKHITVREKIREFLTYYFFPYYPVDLSHNLMYFIVGRYEFRNKGLDIFIKSLGQLNEKLKEEESRRTITVFFWIPMQNSGLKTVVLENKNYFRHIKNTVDYYSDDIMKRIISGIISQKKLSVSRIMSDELLTKLKKDTLLFKREGDPPLCTHYIDEEHDAMVNELRMNGLNNKEEDKVKVIMYPVYLDGSDEMINLNYYDTMAGCHFGIFPSYYEPWGYTPLESMAMGVPALTTDLAGFGRFMKPQLKKKEGLFILDRMGKNTEEVIKNFTDILYDFSKLSHPNRVHNKTVAKSLAKLADWSVLVKNYVEAHDKAVSKK